MPDQVPDGADQRTQAAEHGLIYQFTVFRRLYGIPASRFMKKEEEKTYVHEGKTIRIIPAKRVKKADIYNENEPGEKMKRTSGAKSAKSEAEKGQAKYAVGTKVALKPIPAQYQGAGFGESVITKVFKSTYDQMYRYSIRSVSGHELALVKEEELKPRK